MRRYFAKLQPARAGAPEGETREITVREEGGRLLITLDGHSHEVDALRLDGPSLGLLLDGRSFAADFEERGDQVKVLLEGSVFPVEILDERRLRMRAASGKLRGDGPQQIVAPMPGKVVRILVKVGDEVKEGQGLVVVEAMKMENELKALRAGKVKELFVVEGVAVEGGARLCLVE